MLLNLINIESISRLNKYWYLYVTVIAVLISQFLYFITVVDNSSAISHVSVIAGLNLWFWFIVLIFCLFINYMIDFKNKSIVLDFILINFISLFIGLNLTGNLIALDGTPMTFADIRGDLGNYLEKAERARITGFSGMGYPPIYLTLIGLISKFSNFQVIEIFKFFDLFILLFGHLSLIFVYKKILPNKVNLIFNSILIINSQLTWKNLAFYLFIGWVLIIYLEASSDSTKTLTLKQYYYGLVLGLITLVYYGNLWWAVIALIFLSSYVLIFNQKYTRYMFNIFTGLAVLLIPLFGSSNIPTSSFVIFIAIIMFAIFNLFRDLSKFFSLFIPIGLISLLFLFDTGDTWIDEGLFSQNPTLNLLGGLNYSNLIFLIIFLSIIIFNIYNTDYIRITFPLTLLVLSSLIMMYFFASKTQITGLIELWPRAGGFAADTLQILIYLNVINFLYELVQFLIDKYKLFFELKIKVIVTILIIFLMFPSSYSLFSKIYGSFPTFSNGAWFAHQACSNPHEDPMLAKVFETKPHIQYFLRFNCPNVTWPYIKVAYNGPKNMLMNPYVTFYNKENSKFNWKKLL